MQEDLINIIFHHYGNDYHIVVNQPTGGSGAYFVFQNSYYQGSIVKTSLGWRANLRPCMLTGDDIGEILEMIKDLHDGR